MTGLWSTWMLASGAGAGGLYPNALWGRLVL